MAKKRMCCIEICIEIDYIQVAFAVIYNAAESDMFMKLLKLFTLTLVSEAKRYDIHMT